MTRECVIGLVKIGASQYRIYSPYTSLYFFVKYRMYGSGAIFERPKNRFCKTPKGEAGLNYLCAGYKAFFQRVNEPLKIMAMLLSSGRPASDVMPILAENKEVLSKAYQNAKPEQPCPCNSGLAYQFCHGWKRPESDRRGRSKAVGHPRSPVHTAIKNTF